jgi:hypothetical protein
MTKYKKFFDGVIGKKLRFTGWDANKHHEPLLFIIPTAFDGVNCFSGILHRKNGTSSLEHGYLCCDDDGGLYYWYFYIGDTRLGRLYHE